jgi:hypothetical protein
MYLNLPTVANGVPYTRWQGSASPISAPGAPTTLIFVYLTISIVGRYRYSQVATLLRNLAVNFNCFGRPILAGNPRPIYHQVLQVVAALNSRLLRTGRHKDHKSLEPLTRRRSYVGFALTAHAPRPCTTFDLSSKISERPSLSLPADEAYFRLRWIFAYLTHRWARQGLSHDSHLHPRIVSPHISHRTRLYVLVII